MLIPVIPGAKRYPYHCFQPILQLDNHHFLSSSPSLVTSTVVSFIYWYFKPQTQHVNLKPEEEIFPYGEQRIVCSNLSELYYGLSDMIPGRRGLIAGWSELFMLYKWISLNIFFLEGRQGEHGSGGRPLRYNVRAIVVYTLEADQIAKGLEQNISKLCGLLVSHEV